MKGFITLDRLLSDLGNDAFRGLHYNKELQNDGLSRMMWTVTFILNNDVVTTQPCITPDTALLVAIEARKNAK
jgi:hypothetical protein